MSATTPCSRPQVWADYDSQKQQIINAAGVVAQMYAALPRGEEWGR